MKYFFQLNILSAITKRVHCFYFIFFLLVLDSNAVPKPNETEIDGDLKLRLGDLRQEILTSSVNWIDLQQKVEKRKFHKRAISDGKLHSGESRPRIFIDAGHGGSNYGAAGVFCGIEKYLSLKIARLVKQNLIAQSWNLRLPLDVQMSRQQDVFLSLAERVKMANQWEADAFVSIHGNSSPLESVSGFEVYFLSAEASDIEAANLALAENAGEMQGVKPDVLSILSDVKTNFHISGSSRFAEMVYNSMSHTIIPNKRGVRQAPFSVLVGTEMPSILIEVGYLSNGPECVKLSKAGYLKRVAGAITSGIVEYLSKNMRLL